MYIAYLCYPHVYLEEDDHEPDVEIKFQEPDRYMYDKIIPISFHPLVSWSDKDADLFKQKK